VACVWRNFGKPGGRPGHLLVRPRSERGTSQIRCRNADHCWKIRSCPSYYTLHSATSTEIYCRRASCRVEQYPRVHTDELRHGTDTRWLSVWRLPDLWKTCCSELRGLQRKYCGDIFTTLQCNICHCFFFLLNIQVNDVPNWARRRSGFGGRTNSVSNAAVSLLPCTTVRTVARKRCTV
jgi:hypothetical protein